MSADRANLALAVSTVALVPAVFSSSLPPLSRVRSLKDHRVHLAAAETTAAAVSAALVLSVAAATRSREVAGFGLVAVVLYAGMYAHARRIHP